MISELTLGLLGDLLNTGFKRGVSVAFQKMARLQHIDLTLKGIEKKSPLVQQALLDFEIVIGGYQGKLTVTLDAFLKDVARTGILDAMVENAMISRESPEIKSLFSASYREHFKDEGDANELYKSMSTAFAITIKESSKDTVLSTLVQTIHKDLSSRLDRMDDALRASTRTERRLAQTDPSEIQASLLKIAKGLQNSYRGVRIETHRGPREVEINKVYVPSKLLLRESSNNSKRMDALIRAVQKLSTDNRNYRQSHHYIFAQSPNSLTFLEFTRSFRRAVVLGDPGGGKSTLCQKFCYDLAKAFSLSTQFKTENRIPVTERRLPIRIILRKFEQARTAEPQLDLLTYICRDIVNFAGGTPDEIKDAIVPALESGLAVLAFDGLDEILDTSKRQDFVDLVVAFSNQYPLCPTLVTSRLVGYDDARLPDEFEEVVLQKFDDQEVSAYLLKFMSVVGGKAKPEATKAANDFIEQTENTANDLRRNPLMLGLMGWLFLSSGDVPGNRPEIYKECSILMFERWDQRRGIIADEMNDFDRSHLFIGLASEIYGQPELAGGVSKEWLTTSLQRRFYELFENKSRAFGATKAFVEFVTGRAWVMSEVGDNVYAFTHQTFLEYFFARHLDDRYDGVAAILKALRPRIVRREWNEVAHLALQLKTHRSLRKQEEAISLLLDAIKSAKNPKHQAALITFSARSLEYLSPSEMTISNFLEEISAISFGRMKQDGRDITRFFGVAANSARSRKDFIWEKLGSILKGTLFDSDISKSEAAYSVISNTNLSGYDREATNSEIGLIPRRIRDKVILEVKDSIEDRAHKSQFFAGIGWSWYGSMDERRLMDFGPQIIYNYPHLSGIPELNGICLLAVAACGRYSTSETSVVNTDRARQVMSMLGRTAPQQIPFNRRYFGRRMFRSEPPDHVWDEIYQSLSHDFDGLVGAVIAHQMTSLPHRRMRKLSATGVERLSVRQNLQLKVLGLTGDLDGHHERLRHMITGEIPVFANVTELALGGE